MAGAALQETNDNVAFLVSLLPREPGCAESTWPALPSLLGTLTSFASHEVPLGKSRKPATTLSPEHLSHLFFLFFLVTCHFCLQLVVSLSLSSLKESILSSILFLRLRSCLFAGSDFYKT